MDISGWIILSIIERLSSFRGIATSECPLEVPFIGGSRCQAILIIPTEQLGGYDNL